jgi:putative endonuclease
VTPRPLLERILQSIGVSRTRTYRGLRGKGQQWERLAARRLEAEGYTIRDRNFRARAGEIDLIAEERGVLCFIEVKGRADPGFGSPAEAVTLEKQRRIFRAAEEYLKRRRLGAPSCRFDVVTVVAQGGSVEVAILRNAFEEPAPRASRR